MYVASTLAQARRPLGKVPGTVLALGAVSLLTDISAEMVTAFLPVYLLFTLQLGYVQFGLLDGLYAGATSLLRLVGGHVADRLHRPKAVAQAGYGLSALTKLIFPMAGGSALGIGGVLAVDRAGKGLRTAPRDALLSLSVPGDRLGMAFGVHRSMDTVGALLGPLVTFLLLAGIGSDPQPIFVVSFGFALLGLIVLSCFVRERPRAAATKDPAPSLRDGWKLLAGKDFRRTCTVAAVLGFATMSDAFVFVTLQRSSGVAVHALPLLPLGTALAFIALATPAGVLADRIGRRRMFFAGHVLLLGVYLLMVPAGGGYPVLIAALLLHGAFYAATDGVLAAWASAQLPERLRGSGLAVVQTGQAVARLFSSVLLGLLLSAVSVPAAAAVAAGALLAALAGAFAIT